MAAVDAVPVPTATRGETAAAAVEGEGYSDLVVVEAVVEGGGEGVMMDDGWCCLE